MSRIGKKPVSVPADVKVAVANGVVTIEKGAAKLQMTHRPEVTVTWDAAARQVKCSIPESALKDRTMRAYWGMTRAIIDNMLDGVVTGYQKQLEVVGVGWSAQLQGRTLKLAVGYCKPVEVPIPAGLNVTVEKQIITVKGADKQVVGQFAATVRAQRKPEPYNGKGIKYFDEVISRKQGKQVVGR